jgi:hypothetical protein
MKNKLDSLKFVFFDRTFWTLVLAGILIAIMGSSRPDNNSGLYPNEYFARKSGWKKCADIAVAGDSRVLCGLAPVEMQKYFPGKRIYNYGYGSVWFSEGYMDRIEGLLDPNGQGKTIILGITAHSLMKRDGGSGNLFEVRTKSYRDRFMQIHFAGLLRFFDPLTFSAAIDGLFPSLAESHTSRKFWDDGWIAVHKVPDSIKQSLHYYKVAYEAGQVDPNNIEDLIRYVKRWVGQGIKVYGYIPPTCREMFALESAMSGFDEEDFVRRFEGAGGVWIYIDPVAYHSFDGSHLQDDSAIQLTNDLCKKIIEKWVLKSGP